MAKPASAQPLPWADLGFFDLTAGWLCCAGRPRWPSLEPPPWGDLGGAGHAGEDVWHDAIQDEDHLGLCCQTSPACAPYEVVGKDLWFDVFDGDGGCISNVPPRRTEANNVREGTWTRAEILAAGVPAEAADGITRLAEIVQAKGLEPLSDPLTLLRLYISRDRDVNAAAAMHRMVTQWRLDYAIGLVMAMHGSGERYPDVVNPSHEHGPDVWKWQQAPVSYEAELTARHGFFGRLRLAAPADGAPIVVWRVGTADVAALAREGLVEGFKRALVAHLEDCLQCVRAASLRKKRLICARVIIDVEGIGFTFLRHMSTVREILEFAFAHFPEAVESVTVVRAPSLFAACWRALQPFVPLRTRQKFKVLGRDFGEGLSEHAGLDIAALPRFLGGQASDAEIGAAEPVPRGLGSTVTTPPFHRGLAEPRPRQE